MKRINQKYIIILLMITLLSLTYGIKYLNKSKYEELPEVKLKEKIEKDKTFAIMVQTDNGYEEYKNEDNTWPGDDYYFKEAKCTDNNGALVENALTFESITKTVILETDKTVVCTLYFDESILVKLKENEKILNKNNLSSDLQGGMHRYQGTDDVANWICFGTNDLSECTDETDNDGDSIPDGIDKYMYRIIGITPDGELYLLKETFLKEKQEDNTYVNGFAWNDKYETSGTYAYTCDDKICPEWGQNNLFKRLNGTSNGETMGSGSYSDNADTNIFVNSEYYDYLQSGDKDNGGENASKWYDLILDHKWLYGDTITGASETSTYTGDIVYAIETGNSDTKHYLGIDGNITEETYKWYQKVNAKISLMYIHDYVYSYYDGLTEESRGNSKNYSIAKNGWLFFQKDEYNISEDSEWLSTRWGILSLSGTNVDARYVRSIGSVNNSTLYDGRGIRPVFYLSSKAKIEDGQGTKENPFTLEI